jgi:hypothetical protein
MFPEDNGGTIVQYDIYDIYTYLDHGVASYGLLCKQSSWTNVLTPDIYFHMAGSLVRT